MAQKNARSAGDHYYYDNNDYDNDNSSGPNLRERRKAFQKQLLISTAQNREFRDKIEGLSMEFLMDDINEDEESIYNDFLDACMWWLVMFMVAFLATAFLVFALNNFA
jgi:hypothetical protein